MAAFQNNNEPCLCIFRKVELIHGRKKTKTENKNYVFYENST